MIGKQVQTAPGGKADQKLATELTGAGFAGVLVMVMLKWVRAVWGAAEMSANAAT